jgi:hypothetical protein
MMIAVQFGNYRPVKYAFSFDLVVKQDSRLRTKLRSPC